MSINLESRIADMEIVILGICRDVAMDLESDVERLRDSFNDFKKVHFRFVESDSSDSTVEILHRLTEKIPNFQFRDLGKLQDEISNRFERLAYCRNICIEILDVDPALKNCSYVAVTDLDGTNALLTRDAVLSCWQRDDWDACMANQAAPYYDIFALRHPDWSPDDCWKFESQLLRSGVNPIVAREKAIYSRMIKIEPNSEWIPVDSAFGGLAIYKRHLFEGVSYISEIANQGDIAEHVTIHLQMRAKGAKLFINPALINLGWNIHNVPQKLNKRLKRIVKRILWVLLPIVRKKVL